MSNIINLEFKILYYLAPIWHSVFNVNSCLTSLIFYLHWTDYSFSLNFLKVSSGIFPAYWNSHSTSPNQGLCFPKSLSEGPRMSPLSVCWFNWIWGERPSLGQLCGSQHTPKTAKLYQQKDCVGGSKECGRWHSS